MSLFLFGNVVGLFELRGQIEQGRHYLAEQEHQPEAKFAPDYQDCLPGER